MVSLGDGPDHNDEMLQLFNRRVDDRIDRRFDRFKLWIAGALAMNLMPILALSWWGGSTLAQMQVELRMLTTITPQAATKSQLDEVKQDLSRRVEQNADRIKELEREK